MYKILFLIILMSGLSSCTLPGTQDEWTESSENTILYEDDTISMLLPKMWTPVNPVDIPMPRVGDIITAYTSPEVKYGFSNNIIILHNTLDTIVTSSRYSELNTLQTSRNYLE